MFTARAILTSIHGICFGCFFLLASFGLVVGTAATTDFPSLKVSQRRASFERLYLLVTAALAWVAVLSGTYLIYPWYRATPPLHSTDLRHFSRQLLLSDVATAKWHSIGMEWKEHVSFLAPIIITSVAYVCWRHRDLAVGNRQIRRMLLGFSMLAVAAAGIAACTGAFLNKLAPTF